MATKIKRMKKEEWISNIIEVGDRIERIEPSRDFLNHIVTTPRIKIIAKSSAWLAAASIALLIVLMFVLKVEIMKVSETTSLTLEEGSEWKLTPGVTTGSIYGRLKTHHQFTSLVRNWIM